MLHINDLPLEILAQVFLSASRDHYDEWRGYMIGSNDMFDDQDNRVCAYAWIKATHVCQLWRNIALSYPGLWNNLVTSWPRPQRDWEFLQRSKDLPLAISVIYEIPTGGDLVRHFHPYRHRIESLLIVGEGDELVDLALSAPSLRKLRFTMSCELGAFFEAVQPGQTFPQLECLEAPMSRFPRNPTLTALKTLAMRISLATWIQHMTELGLLETFNHFPQLEVLKIDIDDVDYREDDCDSEGGDVLAFSVPLSTVVHFPSLRHLRLGVYGCTVSPCLWIIDHLKIPRSTRVSIRAFPSPPDAFDNVVLNQVLYSLPAQPPTQHMFHPILSCSIASTLGFAELRGWHTEQPIANASVRPAPTPDPDVYLSLSTLQFSQDEIQRFWKTFPMCGVRSLRLGPMSALDISMVEYLRSAASGAVRELTIVGMLGPLVLDVLSAAQSVEEVSLVECNFTPSEDDGGAWRYWWEPMLKAAERAHIPGSVEALVGLCADRGSMGRPLKKLSIVRSHRVLRGHVDQLRQVAGCVYWDETELNGDISSEAYVWHHM